MFKWMLPLAAVRSGKEGKEEKDTKVWEKRNTGWWFSWNMTCIFNGDLMVINSDLMGWYTAWWFSWNMTFMTFHIVGMSSSQLTNSNLFQRGRSTTNQLSSRWRWALRWAMRVRPCSTLWSQRAEFWRPLHHGASSGCSLLGKLCSTVLKVLCLKERSMV